MPGGCVTASQQKAAQRQAHTGDGRACLFIARAAFTTHPKSTSFHAGPYPKAGMAARQATAEAITIQDCQSKYIWTPGGQYPPLRNRVQAAGHTRQHGGAADGGCNIRGQLPGHGPG